MKIILVTGCAGNIGSFLTTSLVESKKYFVVGVDNLSTGDLRKIKNVNSLPNFKFINADVNDYNDVSAVFYQNKFDYVFHFAAVVGVLRTLENPVKVLNDIKGIENILKLSKNTGVNRVFYSSSSEVYGEPVDFPQHEETTPLNSRLPYAIVKNVGEAFYKSYFQEYGLKYTIFRFFNTYGPNQSKDFVISKFIHKALKNEDITLYGDGLQTRTFCFIKDNVDTMVKVMEDDLYINDVLNIGSDDEMSIKALASLIVELTGSKSAIVHIDPLKEGDMSRRRPDNSKMKKILGRELVSVKEGIKLVLDHLKEVS